MMKQAVCITLLFSILLCLFSGCAASGAGATTPPQTTQPPITTSPAGTTAPAVTTTPATLPPASYTIETAYTFPKRFSETDWASMTDAEKKEILKEIAVPDTYLKEATTPALLETIYGYPFWQAAVVDVYAKKPLSVYSNWAESTDLLIELLSRPDRFEYLQSLDSETFKIRESMTEGNITAADACYEVICRYAYYHIFEPYAYPVTTASPEWATMTPAQKAAACKIPEDILHHLAPEVLMITLANCPLLEDSYSESNITKAMEATGIQKEALTRVKRSLNDAYTIYPYTWLLTDKAAAYAYDVASVFCKYLSQLVGYSVPAVV